MPYEKSPRLIILRYYLASCYKGYFGCPSDFFSVFLFSSLSIPACSAFGLKVSLRILAYGLQTGVLTG